MVTERVSGRLAWLGYGACAMAGCLWGTGFYFGKLALREMGAGHMVLYRFLFACVGMVPILLMQGRVRRPEWTGGWTGRQVGTLLLASALGVPIQFLLQFHGLERTTVSHAALMVGTLPVLLALAATIFSGERLDRVGWVALGCSSVGAGLIVLGGHQAAARAGGAGLAGPTLTGDLMVVVSLVISLGWILMNKSLMEAHGPMAITAYGIFTGTGMLAVWVVAVEGWPPVHLSGTAWMALLASGFLGTAATTLLWNWGIHRVPASRAGVFLNIEPALGSLLGVRLLGDTLGPYAWVGGGLILAAAVTLTARGQRMEAEVILE